MPYYQISYNGYQLPYVRSTITETPQYADDQITLEGTNYNFEFSGYLIGSSNTAQFATNLDAMRCALTVPRENLLVQWSDDNSTWNTLYNFDSSNNNDANSDNAWGPIPGDFKVNKVYGGRAAMYSYSIKVFQKSCCPSGQNTTNEILSVTRKWLFSIDGNGLTNQTVSGTLTIKSNLVAGGSPADNYRYVVTPPLDTNFQRVSQSFTQSEDGRHLYFSISDQEVKYTLPPPITTGNANYAVKIQYQGGMVDISLSGKFSAAASIPKATILTAIFNLWAAKFPPPGGTPTVIYTAREITDDIYNNAISFNMTAQVGMANLPQSGASPAPYYSLGLSSIITSPPGSNGSAELILPYGSSGTAGGSSGAIARPPSIYDNCTSTTPGYPGVNGSPGLTSQGGSGGTGNPLSTYGNYPSTAGISTQHQNSPWIAYHEKMSWEIDNNIVYFTPKVEGEKPIIQQTGVPKVTCIQAGYSSQMCAQASDAAPPNAPFYLCSGSNPQAYMQNCFIEPSNPVIIGDGTVNRYTVHWRYVMVLNNNIEILSDIPNLQYPNDPIRPPGATNTITFQPANTANPAGTFSGVVTTPQS